MVTSPPWSSASTSRRPWLSVRMEGTTWCSVVESSLPGFVTRMMTVPERFIITWASATSEAKKSFRIIARQARLPSVNIRRFIWELACVARRSPPVVHARSASDHESP